MYVRVMALVGYFHLVSQSPSWPLRRARWGHLCHGEVGDTAEAQDFAVAFRDFILAGSTGLCQMDRLSYGTIASLDTSLSAAAQPWEWATLYDHGGQLYPSVDYSSPYWGWTRGWTSEAEHPLPPFIALRYRRIPATAFTGRQHYGYVRTVQCRWANFSGYWAQSYAPYAPVNATLAHTFHVSDALTLSGFDTYHSGAGPREVVLYYREGLLEKTEITGYEQDFAVTTARKFTL